MRFEHGKRGSIIPDLRMIKAKNGDRIKTYVKQTYGAPMASGVSVVAPP